MHALLWPIRPAEVVNFCVILRFTCDHFDNDKTNRDALENENFNNFGSNYNIVFKI